MTVDKLYRLFQEKCASDPSLRSLKRKINSGKADFTDTAAYSERISKLLGQTLSKYIDGIPEGSREQICNWLLQEQYKDTNTICAVVQEALDEAQGIRLTPQKASFPSERVQTVAHALEDPTVKPETIRRRADAPVANVAKSFHDDYIKVNARVRHDLGLKPTITRYGTSCCAWCSAVAGKYRFGEQPEDIFRRHDNCNCTIIYDTQVLRGSRTEDGGRSKTWEEVDPSDVEQNLPTVLSQEQAENLQNTALQGLTLAGRRDIIEVNKYDFNPLSASSVVPILRKESESWISTLTSEEIRAIQKYTKNVGDPKNDKFYARLNAMLRGEISEDETLRYYAELISSALQKNVLQHDVLCYRTLPYDIYAHFHDGDIFSERQFISTSVTASGTLQNPFSIFVHCPSGTSGAYIELLSEYPKQREFLIDKDAWYRVLEKDETSMIVEVLTK